MGIFTKGLTSSLHDDWCTPRDLFDFLNKRFHFTLDPCSSDDNALCDKHYTLEDDGLSKSWEGEQVFMNPPYGNDIPLWCRKAYKESLKGALVVGLVPSRTDTRWWHETIEGKANVLFLKGRVRFVREDKTNSPAPFPSALVIWWGGALLNDKTLTDGSLF